MLENVPSIEQIPRETGHGESTRQASGFTPTPSGRPVGWGAKNRHGHPTRFRGGLSRATAYRGLSALCAMDWLATRKDLRPGRSEFLCPRRSETCPRLTIRKPRRSPWTGHFKAPDPETVARMDIALDSQRQWNDVYLKYFEPSEVGGEAFHTTEVPVRLARLSSELVCRSQAKWVMERATQFKTVGQAFVDEVFRVFAAAHPHIRLRTMGLIPEVAQMLRLFGRGWAVS